MHSITVNKKLDYSVPIIFRPLSAPTASKTTVKPSVVQNKPVPTKTSAKKVTLAPATKAKPPTIAVAADVKKQPTIEPKKIEPVQPPANKTPEPSFAKASANTSADKLAKALDVEQIVVPMEQVKEIQKPSFDPSFDRLRTNGGKNIAPIPNNAHVSNNFREVEALRRGAQLQKELVQKWQPPIGVSPDCMCEISFFVNNKGTIENLKMVKSSGVMMFDISARQALFAMKMPQWTYGNPLIISFKQ